LIVVSGFEVPGILVVTFTEASTKELTDRIRMILSKAYFYVEGKLLSEDSDWDRIKAIVDLSSPEEARRRLKRALINFDNSVISTIHSFCNRALSEWSFECGELFDNEITTDGNEVLETIVKDQCRKIEFGNSLILASLSRFMGLTRKNYLNVAGELARRHDAVIYPEPSVSCPQISDVEALLSRVCSFWSAHRPSILNTYSEGQQDVRKGKGKPGIWYSTFYKGFDGWAKILDDGPTHMSGNGLPDLLEAVSKFSTDLLYLPDSSKGYLQKKYTENPEDFTLNGKQWTLSSKFTEFFQLCDEFSETVFKWKVGRWVDFAAFFREEYRKRKDELRLFTYDDLLLNLRKAISNSDRKELILSQLRKRYSVALVDEFQDTDSVQWDIFRKVFVDGKKPVYLVGDPKQAIYSFRNGDIFTYFDAASRADERFELNRNFRSEAAVIDGVNTLFSSCHETVGAFATDKIKYQKLEARGLDRASSCLIDGVIDPRPLKVRFFDTEDGPQAKKSTQLSKGKAKELIVGDVCDEIVYLLNSEHRIGERKIKPSDICILVTKHAHAQILGEALSLRKVPSVLQKSGNVFFEKVDNFVEDKKQPRSESFYIYYLLKAFREFSRDRDIKTVLSTPMFDLRANDIFEIFGEISDEGLDERIRKIFEEAAIHCRQYSFTRAFTMLDKAFSIRKNLLSQPNGERLLTNVLHQVEVVNNYLSTTRCGFNILIEWFEKLIYGLIPGGSEGHEIRLETDVLAVQIMTVFNSKGLEFPIVFAPFMWDRPGGRSKEWLTYHESKSGSERQIIDFDLSDSFSSQSMASRKDLESDETLAEDLRLLYVSLTRAVHRTYVYWGNINQTGHSSLQYLFHVGDLAGFESVTEAQRAVKVVAFDDVERKCDGSPVEASQHLISDDGNSPQTMMLYHPPGGTTIDTPLSSRKWVQGPRIYGEQLVASYSSMIAQAGHSRFEGGYDFEQDAKEQEGPSLVFAREIDELSQTIFEFPAGASTGTCWHKILELFYSSETRESLPEIIESQLRRHELFYSIADSADERLAGGRRRCDAIESMVAKVGTIGVSETLRLSDLPASSFITEMAFDFSFKGSLSLVDFYNSISEVWDDWKYLARPLSLIDRQVDGAIFTGVIDLVYRVPIEANASSADDYVYSIIDWKSNRLGRGFEDYAPDCLTEAMVTSHYILQLLLYSVALHLFLSRNLKDYSYERHIGKGSYVFLRGLTGNGSDGVFSLKPPFRAIEETLRLLYNSPEGQKL
jgi:exodeoxyribonuclease V beta subunit